MGLSNSVRFIGCTAGAVATALVLTASPASASNSYTGAAYVGGQGNQFDDWDDEGILSTSSNTNSNATCLWQKVLWSWGLLDWSDIDGVFGPKTESATREFQDTFNLTIDGQVGKDTFGKASKPDGPHIYTGFIDEDNDGTVDEYRANDITHTKRSFRLWRNGEGHYGFYDASGKERVAGYNYRTCS